MARTDDIAQKPTAFVDPNVLNQLVQGKLSREDLGVPGQEDIEAWHTIVALAHYYFDKEMMEKKEPTRVPAIDVAPSLN